MPASTTRRGRCRTRRWSCRRRWSRSRRSFGRSVLLSAARYSAVRPYLSCASRCSSPATPCRLPADKAFFKRSSVSSTCKLPARAAAPERGSGPGPPASHGRLARKAESARVARLRKKEYVTGLEDQIRDLQTALQAAQAARGNRCCGHRLRLFCAG